MKVLVTGGTGYIGSHTVVELLSDNFEVVIVDDLSNSSIEVLDGIEKITGRRPEFEQFNLCDKAQTSSFFKKNSDIDAVIHFAAYKAVGESVDKPLSYYRNNIESLINILEGMSYTSSRNLVFSSSCTVYGQPDILPVTESAPIKEAISPYGNTKQIAEEIIRDLILSDKTYNSIALRYFNPIGAHPSALIGELPFGVPNNLIPFITQTAYGIREKLSVYGDDYNTHDGSCIRDYIDVVDLAQAHIYAVRRLLDKRSKENFEIFNIGTGKGVSVMEIIKSFEQETGQKLNYSIVDRRPGDIEKVFADTSYANKELGWSAKKPLGETLRSAWNWEVNYRKNKDSK